MLNFLSSCIVFLKKLKFLAKSNTNTVLCMFNLLKSKKVFLKTPNIWVKLSLRAKNAPLDSASGQHVKALSILLIYCCSQHYFQNIFSFSFKLIKLLLLPYSKWSPFKQKCYYIKSIFLIFQSLQLICIYLNQLSF